MRDGRVSGVKLAESERIQEAGGRSADGEPPLAFDVFMSHNARDKPFVERIAERLKRSGLEPWLDAWQLVPGEDWQQGLAEGLTAFSLMCGVRRSFR